LASSGHDGTAILWDLQTGKKRDILKGHKGFVYSGAFSPDGKTLAAASGVGDERIPGAVKLWDLESKTERKKRRVTVQLKK
jgi:WD40 repeat protein